MNTIELSISKQKAAHDKKELAAIQKAKCEIYESHAGTRIISVAAFSVGGASCSSDDK